MKLPASVMRTAFAKALRTLRKNRGLTQEDFALVSSRTHLSSLERARKNPSLEKVESLAEIIEVHPLTLLTLTWLYHENHDEIDLLFSRVKRELSFSKRNNPMIRVLITDDHAIMRQGLMQLFNLVEDIVVAGEAACGEEAQTRLAQGGIDMLLLDLNMPGISGAELIATLRGAHPDLPILVLSMYVEPQIAQGALDAGANGYLSKDHDPETLITAIRTVAFGGSYLDSRLLDALRPTRNRFGA